MRKVQDKPEQAAIVIHDLGCNLFDGYGNVLSADNSHAVVTNSQENDITVLKCSAKDVPVPEDMKAPFKAEGFLCGTPGGSTTDSHAIVTSSGNSMLTCKFKLD
jgi:hypothetical protein